MTEETEEDILSLLGTTIGFLVESTEIDIPDSVGFAQISNYTQGFEQGILVTWPSDVELALEPSEIIMMIATRLNVTVLLEPNEERHVWLLAKPDGSMKSTGISYLEDGIDVN
jgi:hypothetical protein